MRLTEERKTGVIGFLLSVVLLSQIIQGIAGGKQHAEFNRINWLLNHSNKALALLDNLLGVVILDKDNRAKNFERKVTVTSGTPILLWLNSAIPVAA